MSPSEPRPTDLVCRACGEPIYLVRATPKGPPRRTCPGGHYAAKKPITRKRWLAAFGAAPAADEGGKA